MVAWWISSLVAVGLLVTGACSSGGDGSDASDIAPPDDSPLAQLMADSAAKVSAARTYRFDGTVVYPVGQGVFDITLKGVADTGTGRAVGEARVEPFTAMELDLSRSPLAGARAGPAPMVVDGQIFYLRFPDGPTPGTGQGPGGKLWGRFDLENLAGSAEGFKLLLDKARSAGPDRALALLGRVRDVKEVGTEMVRDTESRHFTMTAAIEEVADGARPEFVTGAQDLLATIGAVTVTVDAWLGPDDLPRRVSYSVDRALRRDFVSATVDLFDFGVAVERTVPPPADVFDFGILAEGTDPAS